VSAWVPGDLSGLLIPVGSHALRARAEEFLTLAMRSSGALAADNRVVGINQFEDWPGGSTGRKLLLAVDYEKRQLAATCAGRARRLPSGLSAELSAELFVKITA